MAKFVDPNVPGQVMELGLGTGAVMAALVERGIELSRMMLVEFNLTFCRRLRTRYPEATIFRGDAYGLKRLLGTLLCDRAAAVVSGLPLVTKHLKIRLRLLTDAFALLTLGAPFVQVTYAPASPIPHSFPGRMRAAQSLSGSISSRQGVGVSPCVAGMIGVG
jgi:phosphatidylethanolamine/phosphatidyl-N-methylethanolamine N-methyltransferase